MLRASAFRQGERAVLQRLSGFIKWGAGTRASVVDLGHVAGRRWRSGEGHELV